MNEIKEDFELAKKAMLNAHDPYSNFKVGVVLTTKNGKKYTGCNIANQGIQSICAERVAFVKAISEGEKEFSRIVVVGGKDSQHLQETLPCGYCRQFMSEFVDSNFEMIALENGQMKKYKMQELLPYGFKF